MKQKLNYGNCPGLPIAIGTGVDGWQLASWAKRKRNKPALAFARKLYAVSLWPLSGGQTIFCNN